MIPSDAQPRPELIQILDKRQGRNRNCCNRSPRDCGESYCLTLPLPSSMGQRLRSVVLLLETHPTKDLRQRVCSEADVPDRSPEESDHRFRLAGEGLQVVPGWAARWKRRSLMPIDTGPR